jgi:phosphatidylserine synthase
MKMTVLAGCIAGAISDWADGFIARKYNQTVSIRQINILLSGRHFFTTIE